MVSCKKAIDKMVFAGPLGFGQDTVRATNGKPESVFQAYPLQHRPASVGFALQRGQLVSWNPVTTVQKIDPIQFFAMLPLTNDSFPHQIRVLFL